jgi:hypothetical protein
MIETRPWRGPIELRNSDKDKVELPEDAGSVANIALMTDSLDQINAAIGETFVGLFVPDATLTQIWERLGGDSDHCRVDFRKKQLYRVFNNSSLEEGGRFFGGWWEQIPSEYRKYIMLSTSDNRPRATIELDYSSMHPAIAYASKDMELEHDPYAVEPPNEFDDTIESRSAVRKAAKLAFNIMLNSARMASAELAIRNELVQLRISNGGQSGEGYLPPGFESVDDLMSALEARNTAISDLLCSGFGTSAMKIESDIAESLMLRMRDDYGTIVLPVHDSFIVNKEFAHELNLTMRDAFLAATGCECAIDFETIEGEVQESEMLEYSCELGLFGDDENAQRIYDEHSVFYTLWNDWSM